MHYMLKQDQQEYASLNYDDGYQVRIMWIFRSFYMLDKCPDFKNIRAPKGSKTPAKEPTVNDIHNTDYGHLATPILTNLCWIAAINKMIGMNVWNSPYQCALLASKYNNISVERELLNFVRSGTVDMPPNSVLIVVQDDENYFVGLGLCPVRCFTEEAFARRADVRPDDEGKYFSGLLWKNTRGAAKIACISIEKAQAKWESGPWWGEEQEQFHKDNTNGDLVGDMHGYAF